MEILTFATRQIVRSSQDDLIIGIADKDKIDTLVPKLRITITCDDLETAIFVLRMNSVRFKWKVVVEAKIVFDT
jgi:hypothetical protein